MPLRLGVVWYRTVDEAHNADGKHVAYLREGHTAAKGLRALDPELYDGLRALVGDGQRSVAALAAADLLPVGTVYVNDVLDYAALSNGGREARIAHRQTWLDRALAETGACDLIFADPDNGIRLATHRTAAHQTRAVKHAYLNELEQFAARGQSLVVYHHADRSAPTAVQAQRRLADLAGGTSVVPVAAVRASRGTTRLFLVGAATRAAATYLERRLRDLDESSWRTELLVYWSDW